ncbi:hypothetical protein HanXRQr2_Chr08g0361381 [Helianthus annuus]|uniref:Uncharacterized protein n=1 Tax=Helianthus annuus TaxID=4232 RepID=A0A9K3IIX9_HELAN|nr:hypothetical protein HanXRQr2_Chr08g0361381 [Helianthus annuus]KAJ0903408.1 hypothetical protein HanPSC8_Chr08g0348691 [Helianthus annuus]
MSKLIHHSCSWAPDPPNFHSVVSGIYVSDPPGRKSEAPPLMGRLSPSW